MDSRSVIFHVHVRKCGGSTFYQQVLQRNCGGGFYRDSSLIDDVYGCEQVRQILGHCPWLTAYSSHKITLDLPYAIPERQLIAIAFVRDPVERFFSQYAYLRHHPKQWDSAARELSLDNYIAHVEQHVELQQLRQASQLQHLTGARGAEGLNFISSLLSHPHLHLIPIDQFDAACVLFERAYPTLLRDCSYASTVNRSRIDDRPSLKQRARVEQLIDESDHQLLACAQERFQSSLQQCGLVDITLRNELADFQSRCQARRRQPWWSWLRRARDNP